MKTVLSTIKYEEDKKLNPFLFSIKVNSQGAFCNIYIDVNSVVEQIRDMVYNEV